MTEEHVVLLDERISLPAHWKVCGSLRLIRCFASGFLLAICEDGRLLWHYDGR